MKLQRYMRQACVKHVQSVESSTIINMVDITAVSDSKLALLLI